MPSDAPSTEMASQQQIKPIVSDIMTVSSKETLDSRDDDTKQPAARYPTQHKLPIRGQAPAAPSYLQQQQQRYGPPPPQYYGYGQPHPHHHHPAASQYNMMPPSHYGGPPPPYMRPGNGPPHMAGPPHHAHHAHVAAAHVYYSSQQQQQQQHLGNNYSTTNNGMPMGAYSKALDANANKKRSMEAYNNTTARPESLPASMSTDADDNTKTHRRTHSGASTASSLSVGGYSFDSYQAGTASSRGMYALTLDVIVCLALEKDCSHYLMSSCFRRPYHDGLACQLSQAPQGRSTSGRHVAARVILFA